MLSLIRRKPMVSDSSRTRWSMDANNNLARRGAPFTFWPEGLLNVVKALRTGKETVLAPGFDHAKKDPVEGEYVIGPKVRVVVLEGSSVPIHRLGNVLAWAWYANRV